MSFLARQCAWRLDFSLLWKPGGMVCPVFAVKLGREADGIDGGEKKKSETLLLRRQKFGEEGRSQWEE